MINMNVIYAWIFVTLILTLLFHFFKFNFHFVFNLEFDIKASANFAYPYWLALGAHGKFDLAGRIHLFLVRTFKRCSACKRFVRISWNFEWIFKWKFVMGHVLGLPIQQLSLSIARGNESSPARTRTSRIYDRGSRWYASKRSSAIKQIYAIPVEYTATIVYAILWILYKQLIRRLAYLCIVHGICRSSDKIWNDRLLVIGDVRGIGSTDGAVGLFKSRRQWVHSRYVL